MTSEQIIQLIEEKEAFHRTAYKEFCEQNTGYIMNGHLTMADKCKEILDKINEKHTDDHPQSQVQ